MSAFEMGLLTLTIFTGASIVYSTLCLGISPMPSSKKARLAMIQLCDETGIGPIYELGSGWGNLLIPLAKKYPYRKIVGYELSIMPWLTSFMLIKALGLNNVQVHRTKILMHADLISRLRLLCVIISPRNAELGR